MIKSFFKKIHRFFYYDYVKSDYRSAIKYMRRFGRHGIIPNLSKSDCFILHMLAQCGLAEYYVRMQCPRKIRKGWGYLSDFFKDEGYLCNNLVINPLLFSPSHPMSKKEEFILMLNQTFRQDMKPWLREHNLPYRSNFLNPKHQDARKHAKGLFNLCVIMHGRGLKLVRYDR